MSDEPKPCLNRAEALLAALGVAAFLVWLCWLVTTVVVNGADGIPEEASADFATTGLLAAAGVAAAAFVAVPKGMSPLDLLTSLGAAIRGLWVRK